MRNLFIIALLLPFMAVRDHRYLPAKYYFSATGSDGGAGTFGSPWQTAPKFNGLTLAAGDSVFFKGGDKFTGTFRLNQSGSLGNQIVITSYGTGNAIFTGFAPLSGFTNVSGSVYEATCSGCTAYVNEVRFNGNDQYMGRWPDTSNGQAGYKYFSTGTTSSLNISLPTDTNFVGSEAVVRTLNFLLDRSPVSSQTSTSIGLSTPLSNNPLAGYGIFFQNAPWTLTLLGEWYWKNSTGKMQMYLPGGLGSNTVEAAITDTILSIGGSYLTVKGITIEGANKYGICFTGNVSRDSILNCQINFTGINAIEVRKSTNTVLSRCGVMNTTIRYAHNNAISVIYPAEVDDSQIKLDTMLYCADIPGMGQSGLASNSAVQWFGSRDSIWQNVVFHVGGSGFAQYGGDTNVYYHNFIDSFALHLCDAGAIYISVHSGVRNTLLENICIRGKGQHYGTTNGIDNYTSGIYLDNGAQNIWMEGNTLAWNSYNGWFDHASKNCVHRYNTAFFNTISQWYVQEDVDTAYNNTFVGNILVSPDSSSTVATWYLAGWNNLSRTILLSDSNVFARPKRDGSTFRNNGGGTTQYNLAGWQYITGQDLHSKSTPLKISDDRKMLLLYNPTLSDSTVSVPEGYVDAYGVKITAGPYLLHPFKSLVLLPMPIKSFFMRLK